MAQFLHYVFSIFCVCVYICYLFACKCMFKCNVLASSVHPEWRGRAIIQMIVWSKWLHFSQNNFSKYFFLVAALILFISFPLFFPLRCVYSAHLSWVMCIWLDINSSMLTSIADHAELVTGIKQFLMNLHLLVQ